MMRLLQIMLFGFSLFLLACDNSDRSTRTAKTKILEGVVSYQGEPVTQGTILVKDKNNRQLASIAVTEAATYRVEIPQASIYPLLLQLVRQGDMLEAVVMSSNSNRQDITSLSTLVVSSARDLGGLTKGNMAQAAMHAIQQSKKSSGKGTSTGFKGDPTKQYGGWH